MWAEHPPFYHLGNCDAIKTTPKHKQAEKLFYHLGNCDAIKTSVETFFR